jgi:surface polysaccharide O-acyltransferase-like enzyme
MRGGSVTATFFRFSVPLFRMVEGYYFIQMFALMKIYIAFNN